MRRVFIGGDGIVSCRWRVIYGCYIHRHCIGGCAVCRAVIHAEGEARIGVAAGVSGRGKYQIANISLGNIVARAYRITIKRQCSGIGQCCNRHMGKAVAVDIGKVKLASRECMRGIFRCRHRIVSRGRRIIYGRYIDCHCVTRAAVAGAIIHAESKSRIGDAIVIGRQSILQC